VGDILLLRALTATEIGLVGQLKFPCWRDGISNLDVDGDKPALVCGWGTIRTCFERVSLSVASSLVQFWQYAPLFSV
jgi:hypothetical protein